MPVLLEYPSLHPHSHCPGHGTRVAAWAPLNIKSSFGLSKAPCFSDSFARKADRPLGLRNRNQPRRCHSKPRLERGMAKPTKHLPSSKSKALSTSSRPTHPQPIITNSHPHLLNPSSPLIKGILLTKHSPCINLSLPITSIADSANSDRHTTIPVRKKVRFSSRADLGSVNGNGWHLNPTNHSEDHLGAQLEPVIETIFFTHSRYAYDRSPITVDKVLNKSLTLPPRSSYKGEEDHTPHGLNWLTQLDLLEHRLTASSCELGSIIAESPRKRYFTAAQADLPHPFDLNPESPSSLTPSPVLLATRSHPSYSDFDRSICESPTQSRHPESHLNKRANGQEGGVPSSKNLKPARSTIDRLKLTPHQAILQSSIPTTIEDQDGHDANYHLAGSERRPTKAVEGARSRDSLDDNEDDDDLKLEENEHRRIENCCILLEGGGQQLAGFGNWTRAQVFGSCDALDGF